MHVLSRRRAGRGCLALLPATALVAAFAAPGLRAQQVIVVDAAGGPGSDYSDLKVALAAAAEGDILLLRSGEYFPNDFLFNQFVVSKSIVLQADTGADVKLRGGLRVRNLSATQWFTLRGVSVEPAPAPFLAPGDLEVFDCSGPVRIEDARIGPSSSINKFLGIAVGDSRDVSLARATTWLGIGPKPFILSNPSAFGWTGSRGTIHDSTITSFTYGNLVNEGAHGGCALTLHTSSAFADSTVLVSGSRLVATNGGNGTADASGCGSGGDGGDAVTIGPSSPPGVASLHVLDSQLLPGAGGIAPAPCSAGDAGQPVHLWMGTSTTHAGVAHSLAATSPVREGETLELTVTGAPSPLVVLLYSQRGGYLELGGITGPLLLAPPLAVFPLGDLPGVEPKLSRTLAFQVHELGAGVEGVLLRFQAAFLHPFLGTFLSNESDTVLLDASL